MTVGSSWNAGDGHLLGGTVTASHPRSQVPNHHPDIFLDELTAATAVRTVCNPGEGPDGCSYYAPR